MKDFTHVTISRNEATKQLTARIMNGKKSVGGMESCPLEAALKLVQIVFEPEDEDLGEALGNYTNPDHPEYDPAFDAEVRKLRPDWFEDVN